MLVSRSPIGVGDKLRGNDVCLSPFTFGLSPLFLFRLLWTPIDFNDFDDFNDFYRLVLFLVEGKFQAVILPFIPIFQLECQEDRDYTKDHQH